MTKLFAITFCNVRAKMKYRYLNFAMTPAVYLLD